MKTPEQWIAEYKLNNFTQYSKLAFSHDELVRAVQSIQADAQPQWAPISEAPKDGTLVLLSDGKYRHVGYYCDKPNLGGYGPWHWGIVHQPTHFMPLPEPPEK